MSLLVLHEGEILDWQLIADLAPMNRNYVDANLRPTSLTNKQGYLNLLYGYMDQKREATCQKAMTNFDGRQSPTCYDE
jgi:hypothetical protein